MCGFIGLFFFFPSLLFCLGCFLVGVTHPDLVPFSKHPPFLEMISPGPERPRLTGSGLASGNEGDRDPGPAPPVHLLSTPGSQLVSDGPLRFWPREESKAQSGGRPVTQSHLPTDSKGSPTQLGAVGSSFSLFFSVLSSGLPTPRSQDHRNWRGSGEGGRSDGVCLIHRETSRF